MNPSTTRVAARFLSSTDNDIPVFLDYQEALDWIQAKGREYGGVKRFTSSPLYQRAAPLIADLYKAQKSKSDSKIQQEFRNSGMAIGDAVELHQLGMFLTQVHLVGVIVSRAGVPHVQIEPNPFTPRRLVRWDARWQKT